MTAGMSAQNPQICCRIVFLPSLLTDVELFGYEVSRSTRQSQASLPDFGTCLSREEAKFEYELVTTSLNQMSQLSG
jgi:hypothetical protein